MQIILHDRYEVPNAHQTLKLPPSGKHAITLKPFLTVSDENVKHYMPEKRKCFFDEERKLYYFRKYTQENCEFECVVNTTRDNCGCAMMFMPRKSCSKHIFL